MVDIVTIGGETLLLETMGLDQKEEENIISRFKEDRTAQYQEFLMPRGNSLSYGFYLI
ncbi:MAG: hypothetical protein P4L49_01195 [Desulfosporosinus sp.]|nr:hypothetical protein [Desulfosporosinus sp.]